MLANCTSQLLQQNNVLMPSEKPVTARSPETKGSTERKTVKSTTKPDLEVIEVDFVEPTSQGNTNERFVCSGSTCIYRVQQSVTSKEPTSSNLSPDSNVDVLLLTINDQLT